jgi:hypothetical protein
VKITFIILIFLAPSLLAAGSALAQTVGDEPSIVESDSSGEIASSEIASMLREARQDGERLFVIVRLGTGEMNRRLNFVRLFNTRQYILEKGFDRGKTIFAEGELVKGEGRIEFYRGSRLRLVLLAPRNGMPNLTCCEEYIPPAKKKPNRNKGSLRK